jgi:hypothetical protein
MWMPGETGQVFIGIAGMEIIEHQKGIEQRHLMVAESPLEVDAGTFDGRSAPEYLEDSTSGHGTVLPLSR